MKHLTEEQLVLHYYGEDAAAPAAAHHLAECSDCRGEYEAMRDALHKVEALPVPEPDADYTARLWNGIAGQVSKRTGGEDDRFLSSSGLAQTFSARLLSRLTGHKLRWPVPLTAAVAGLVIAAFLLGRHYPVRVNRPAPQRASLQAREGVLQVALSSYLDRSKFILIELANADPAHGLDISSQQVLASDLVSEARLYRQTAGQTGDAAVSGVLDDLERILLDISHEPSKLSPQDLERLRERLKTDGVLFKIRILGSNLKRAEAPEPEGPQAL
jgi:hypothetical protein